MLKVGDKVIVVKNGAMYTTKEMIGWKGKVVNTSTREYPGIEFEKPFRTPFEGHSCHGTGKMGRCGYISEFLLKKIVEEQLEFEWE